VDTGGTFTDLVLVDGEELAVAKLPSTPRDPGAAVLAGIAGLESGPAPRGERVVHGTTVALNALLTGSTARTALVTNSGFADLIEIARQDRPELYALHPVKPPELVPRELRFEVVARAWPDPVDRRGRLMHVAVPDTSALDALVRAVAAARPESIAVCLLHSYAEPEMERRVARALAPLGVPVTTSAELYREYREYERFSTAVVNAALAPVMSGYLSRLEAGLARARPGASLELLQSSGGALPAADAAREPVRVLLSGPAGGVVGASRAAAEAGFGRMVGLDMGGTSTDVAFHAAEDEHGMAPREAVPRLGGRPVGVPSLDVHTIGCGGGSLVHIDPGGVLHVGPESAGADPGPVAYGASSGAEHLTVTDAHVHLGHVAEGRFLAGRLPLHADAVARAFEELGRRLGVRASAAAEAVLAVARAGMRRALGVMTMQRGVDPARVPLVAFGGAGGLHAAALAESLGMPAALVPRHPGLLSALGMASAEPLCELSRSVLRPLAEVPLAERRLLVQELAAAARERLVAAGALAGRVRVEGVLDLRYAGQSFEIRVPAAKNPAAEFTRRHEHYYGYRLEDRPIEWVALRAIARVPSPASVTARPRIRPLSKGALLGERRALFGGKELRARCVDRAALGPGERFDGPALVEELSGTTLVPPGWSARVVQAGHLLLERD
jgi:N-methylhydantoinase A